MSAILIVGASGILAPAAVRLVDDGHRVTGVGRTTLMPAGVVPFLVDARQEGELRDTIAAQRWDLALVYAPAVSEESMKVLRSVVDGRTLLVRTTGCVAPDSELVALGPDTLQLGWHVEPDGSTRWHTPSEVSAAAIALIEQGSSGLLGTLQPWRSKP